MSILLKSTQNKVLIVEDDPIVALDLTLVLTEMGCDVIGVANDHSSAVELMESSPAHILLCDIHLQNSSNGIEVSKTISQHFSPQIIYLTALEDHATIQAAIDTNPCGYLAKPYRYPELMALIQLARQRIAATSSNILALGGNYFYDKENGLISKGDEIYYLTGNEQKLLIYLAFHCHKIVPFEELEHYVWTQKLVGESSRRTLMYRLHTKLNHQIITVIHRRGCYLTHYPPKSF